ncbi:hypothetical protein AGR4C_Cc160220 [Agrobacterium tumefaciens str. Kerr 14]|uniref:Methyl-accepting transducer domain-containing protein n=2 Tax=Agrobacterium TaxID=357 RepID=A0A1S7R8C3_9HYPH|nr:hypothetical protein AGR4C_Cc160220 [Agrobacterium tumefaciens str. Kerr 14]CUX48669.1 hypothetical protein AGR7C_Lc140026 [Agrobacterium deltaense Zutra 3/1]
MSKKSNALVLESVGLRGAASRFEYGRLATQRDAGGRGGSDRHDRHRSTRSEQQRQRPVPPYRDQAASLEETAAALDQITVKVGNASKRTNEARQVAELANASASQSGSVVTNAVNAMGGIEQSSNEISNIIGVIDRSPSRPICLPSMPA